MDFELYNDTYDQLCERIQWKGARVLEIDCGPENITKYLINKRPDLVIKAIDSSQKMIDLAKTLVPNVNFQVLDARFINTFNEQFNAAVIGFCLPYLTLNDTKELIYRSNKLLGIHGLIYLSYLLGNMDDSNYVTNSQGDWVFFHYYSEISIPEILIASNFQILSVINKQYPKGETTEVHQIIIAEKLDTLRR